MPKKFFLLAAAALAFTAFVSYPRLASAECGSSASSCRDCHEVKKQAPVNTNGIWHTEHAFGDFCEFCHGGNVKAKAKDAAHVGLTSPLSDVKSSCQSCHPNDYMDRAQNYATALGKPLGSSDTPVPTPAAGSAVVAEGVEPCGPSAPAGGQLIDLNKVYADTKKPPSGNLGNNILIGLIGATAVAFAGLVWHFDRPMDRALLAFHKLLATPAAIAPSTNGDDVEIPASLSSHPELSQLFSRLRSADPDTLRALTHLLSDDKNGPILIKALSNLDVRALASIGKGDQKALAALLALAREIRS